MADTQSTPVIVAEGLIKQFGRFAALRGVDARFSAGKLYVILGDNGAGKTTLLRIIAGLAHPSGGKIKVLGCDEVKAASAEIGYMAHPSLLYDEMSGLENLRYFAELYGAGSGEIDRRCRQAIESVKLDPDLERPVGQYSQGMRQRMSLARALVNDPKLVLLDEPFSNVDSGSAADMAALLSEIRDRGKTVVIVTHQPAQLRGLADEFIWMERGRIVNRTTSWNGAAQ